MWNRLLAASLIVTTALVLPALVLPALVLPALASAQARGSATTYVQHLNEQVDALMARPVPTEEARAARDARVGAIIDRLLDYDAFARATLGAQWAPRTEAEQHEFLELLTANIQHVYLGALDRIREQQITYLGEEATADGVVVHARAQSRTSRRQPPVEIDYVMRSEGGTWRVVDVITDESSLVTSQGSAFRAIIAEHGWPEFITRLRARLAEHAG